MECCDRCSKYELCQQPVECCPKCEDYDDCAGSDSVKEVLDDEDEDEDEDWG